MSSAGSPPNPWPPFDAYRDCAQGICSIYCPQWCYLIFPPPPPSGLNDDSSSTDFSPLIIAVIGILASAFILLSYYTIISKYCRRRGQDNSSTELNENRDEMSNNGLQGASAGLDEALMKSITVCKYRKGEGLVEGTDCSVCLSEFEEDESLKLLPKCNHAFHVPCIDTWLKSHSSCPLCRANIASSAGLPNQAQVLTQETAPGFNASALQYRHQNDAILVIQDIESGVREELVACLVGGFENVPKTPAQAAIGTENATEIRPFRRSASFSSSPCQGQLSIADILRISEEEDDDDIPVDHPQSSAGIGSSKQFDGKMKRSISTGRFMSSRYERGVSLFSIENKHIPMYKIKN
ncbi:hypothetical protein SLE2022_132750 [Rubroshorea leprosula]